MSTPSSSETLSFLNPATERIIGFEPKDYDFPGLLRDLFKCDDLQKLHEVYPEESNFPLHDRFSNTRTWFHDRYYERLRAGWPELCDMYQTLVQLIAREFLGEKQIIFQKEPTLRVSVP